jgi:hypothetical protein
MKIIILITLLILLAGCAPGPNSMSHVPSPDGKVAGFWLGLWQGGIAPVTFVISLFRDDVSVYEVHNSGGWYNFGFVLGAGILSGGLFRGSRRDRRKH